MHKTRTSATERPLLMFLTGMLIGGCAAGSKRCEVKDIHITSDETNSTYVYNFTYKDPSCTDKGKLRVSLKGCNDTADPSLHERKGEGMLNNCYDEGRWKVRVSHGGWSAAKVESSCFKCMGQNLKGYFILSFDVKAMKLKINGDDPRVKSWNLTIYKTTDATDYFHCNKYTPKRIIEQRFQETHLRAQNTKRTVITLNHDFDPHGCYCFLVKPITDFPLWPLYIPVSTNNCRPHPASSENGVLWPDAPRSMSRWESVALMILFGIIFLAVMMAVVTVYKPLFLSKIPGLKGRRARQESPLQKPVLSLKTAVLLLYAPDALNNEHFATFRERLQATFTVYDLFDGNDHKRLADSCGWMEEMLMPGSGVKLVLVESVVLVDMINSMFIFHPENPEMAKVPQISSQTQLTKNLLTFALRTIFSTDLRTNFSTVFVVMLSDEVTYSCIVDLLVPTRRFKFPNHFSMLTEAMKEDRCSTKEREVV